MTTFTDTQIMQSMVARTESNSFVVIMKTPTIEPRKICENTLAAFMKQERKRSKRKH